MNDKKTCGNCSDPGCDSKAKRPNEGEIEPDVATSGHSGTPIVQVKPHSETAKAFGRIVRTLLEPELRASTATRQSSNGRPLRIAVPITPGVLSSHFGHCEVFRVFDIDEKSNTTARVESLPPPHHEPGTFPQWLREQGATVILAGGMGSRDSSGPLGPRCLRLDDMAVAT